MHPTRVRNFSRAWSSGRAGLGFPARGVGRSPTGKTGEAGADRLPFQLSRNAVSCHESARSSRLEVVSDAPSFVILRYRVRPDLSQWVLPEGTVPESVFHDQTANHIHAVLSAWAARQDHAMQVARNLAIRFLEQAPSVGIDPDVCVLDPAAPEGDRLNSLCLWKPGHVPPRVCFEIVSPKHPHKDYRDVHERYAAIGARELVIFDPLMAGPASMGGPLAIQLWRPDVTGAFERVAAGDGPVYSEALACWLRAEDGKLVLSDDREGARRWLSEAEEQRAEKERERTDKERALARVAELEARLAK